LQPVFGELGGDESHNCLRHLRRPAGLVGQTGDDGTEDAVAVLLPGDDGLDEGRLRLGAAQILLEGLGFTALGEKGPTVGCRQ
jgi:hypothetical protein